MHFYPKPGNLAAINDVKNCDSAAALACNIVVGSIPVKNGAQSTCWKRFLIYLTLQIHHYQLTKPMHNKKM